jgi:hypothetical protein
MFRRKEHTVFALRHANKKHAGPNLIGTVAPSINITTLSFTKEMIVGKQVFLSRDYYRKINSH